MKYNGQVDNSHSCIREPISTAAFFNYVAEKSQNINSGYEEEFQVSVNITVTNKDAKLHAAIHKRVILLSTYILG